MNAYRHDGWDFARLLREAAAVPGIARLRFTSPHPADMSDAVIDAMAECPAVMPQLHLPVQSGSDRVLARMARDYDVGALRGAGGAAARARPRASRSPPTSSSGFRARTTTTSPPPRRCCVACATTRRSSSATRRARARAPPAGRTTCPTREKARRLERLIALQETISAERNRALVGADVEVLVEGPARRPEGWSAARRRT